MTSRIPHSLSRLAEHLGCNGGRAGAAGARMGGRSLHKLDAGRAAWFATFPSDGGSNMFLELLHHLSLMEK